MNCRICNNQCKVFIPTVNPFYYCDNCFHTQRELATFLQNNFETQTLEGLLSTITNFFFLPVTQCDILVIHPLESVPPTHITSHGFSLHSVYYTDIHSYRNQSFDMIIDLDSMSHSSNPISFLKDIHEIASFNTVIIAQCHKSLAIINHDLNILNSNASNFFSINSFKYLSKSFFNIKTLRESDISYVFTMNKITHICDSINSSQVIDCILHEMVHRKLYDDIIYTDTLYKLSIYKNILHNILLHYKLKKYSILVYDSTNLNIFGLYGLDNYIDTYVLNLDDYPYHDNICLIITDTHSSEFLARMETHYRHFDVVDLSKIEIQQFS